MMLWWCGRIGLATVLAAAAMLTCATAQVSKNVALVIGNSAYRSVPALANPLNDANEVGNALARLGFSVTRIKDASYSDLRRAFLEFGRGARNASTAVVFYAGHGIEVGGENWLVPVDAELRSDTDVEHEAIGLKGAMLTVEGASRLGLVILDACRNNPFAAKMKRSARTRTVAHGLAQVEPSGNVLVAYSAKDGTLAADGEGPHSPFTGALLRHIETPGLEITFMFRNVRDDVMRATNREQQPFVYGSLSREAIYLKPGAPATTLPPALPAAPSTLTPDFELAYWNSISDSTNISELESYLKSYPNGAFAALARLRIDDLQRRGVPPQRVTTASPEAQAALVQEIKKELKRVGCYAGRIDDNWASTETRSAVGKFVIFAKLPTAPTEPVIDFLEAVRGNFQRVCPVECNARQVEKNGRCITKTCRSGFILNDSGACEQGKRAKTAARPPEPRPSEPARARSVRPDQSPSSSRPWDPHDQSRRVTPGGKLTCGRNGCQTVPQGCVAIRNAGGGGLGGKIVCP